MKLRLRSRVTLVVLVAVGAGIQFVPVERTNPPVVYEVDAPDSVLAVLRRSCYDCHSNETRWPWYSYVAPLSWFVVGHVNDARKDLNFTEWPEFDFEFEDDAFHDIAQQVSKGKMPLRSYTLIHRRAALSPEAAKLLLRWADRGDDDP